MNLGKKNINANSTIFITIAAIFLIAGIIAGLLISGIMNRRPSSAGNIPKGSEDTFDAGWKAAREKIETSNLLPVIKGGTKSIKGSVAEIKDNKIIITADLLNPLDDEKLAKRTVNIDDSTKIIIRSEKNRDAIRQEHEEYNIKMQEFREGKSELPPAPEIFEEKQISIKELTIGQLLTVESNDNIRESLEFTASKITIR